MSFKIFVGSLIADITDDILRREFETAGEVKEVVRLRENRAFILYDTLEEAQAAIEKFNGAELAGTKLLVENARSTKKPEKGPIRYDLRVRVLNFERGVSWQDLKDWARDTTGCEVTYSNVFELEGRQQGLVEFKDEESVEKAIQQLPDTPLKGNKVTAERADPNADYHNIPANRNDRKPFNRDGGGGFRRFDRDNGPGGYDRNDRGYDRDRNDRGRMHSRDRERGGDRGFDHRGDRGFNDRRGPGFDGPRGGYDGPRGGGGFQDRRGGGGGGYPERRGGFNEDYNRGPPMQQPPQGGNGGGFYRRSRSRSRSRDRGGNRGGFGGPGGFRDDFRGGGDNHGYGGRGGGGGGGRFEERGGNRFDDRRPPRDFENFNRGPGGFDGRGRN